MMAKTLTQLPSAVGVNYCLTGYTDSASAFDFEKVGKITRKRSTSSLVVANVTATFIVKGRRLLNQVPANVHALNLFLAAQ